MGVGGVGSDLQSWAGVSSPRGAQLVGCPPRLTLALEISASLRAHGRWEGTAHPCPARTAVAAGKAEVWAAAVEPPSQSGLGIAGGIRLCRVCDGAVLRAAALGRAEHRPTAEG